MIGFLRRVSSVRSALPAPEPQTIQVEGRALTLRFKRNARARRMVLRFDGKSGALVMTLPKHISLTEALRFVHNATAWIMRQLEKQPTPFTLREGAEMLLRGETHRLTLPLQKRGLVTIGDRVISVPGGEAHAARRLRDHLKKMAVSDLSEASRHYAAAMNTKYKSVVVRDQRSRWGSCSATGTLSYSWRLILAPSFVLDYVAAHEVAHLREMNHGPRFWRLVLTHCPNAKPAKQWLKENGRKVHSYL